MARRTRNALLATLAAGLITGPFLLDANFRPASVTAERAEQIERCLAADPLGERDGHADPVQRECAPLLATHNCRAAWAAHNRGDPAAHNPQRACLASICDEWTTTPRFCRHPDYGTDTREALYYTALMASAVLGRGLTEAEDRVLIERMNHLYCQGLTPNPALAARSTEHLDRTWRLAAQLVRLTLNYFTDVPPWRPPGCEPRWGP
ncbi:MAG: hypothetical protein H6702_10870 [Myxococcales bacterium]|nr:hypothetical protein [Myxococcales bacterium]